MSKGAVMIKDHFLMKLEEAALNAYPAPKQLLYDGWLMRFLGGPSKRVNSVNVLYPSSVPFSEKISYCESIYSSQGLQVIFRVPDPFTTEALNTALLAAGYTSYDPTFVLGRKIQPGIFSPHSRATLREMSIPDWMQLRSFVGDVAVEKIAYLERILEIIVPEKVLLGCFVDQEPAACGIAVREEDYLGYFSIYTHHHIRRKGYAKAVMAALTGWGLKNGANFGYLQVEGDNTPAKKLYGEMGFEACYRYVYWKKM